MTEVLITGSSGFIGQNVLAYFDDRFQCRSLNRKELTEVSAGSINKSNIVLHLAGKAHDLKNLGKIEEYYQVNFELTKQVYNAFLKSNANKFIFISSVKAVADHLDKPLTEKLLPDPQTHYGKSKLMAEEYIMSQPLPFGKSYYILRPCMTYGPGNKGNLNMLYSFVKKGVPYPLSAFENTRSFLSVENLCFVIKELIIQNGILSGVYNVADNERLSTNELIKIIYKSMNKDPRLWHIWPALIETIAHMGDHLQLPLNTDRLKKLTENFVVDNSKIKQALGIFLPVKTEDGICDTINSFQNSKNISIENNKVKLQVQLQP